MILIERKYHFYAAHRNKAAGEKCGRIHGHTYDVVCCFKFITQNESGITTLFADIDKQVEPIIKQFDHYFLLYKKDELCDALKMLDEIFVELEFETSAENMAVWLFGLIKQTGLPISRIELAETKSSNVIYEP